MKKNLFIIIAALLLITSCTPGATPVGVRNQTVDAPTLPPATEPADAPEEPTAAPTASTDAATEPTAAPTEPADATTEPTEAAVAAAATEPAPTSTNTPVPVPNEPIPPLVLSTVPELGAEQPLDAPIEITFDQPMDRASVEQAFTFEPGAADDGTFDWVDDQTIAFTPAGGLERGERYRVQIDATAESQAGLPMNRPFDLRFSAVGLLEVANVQPADGVTDVAADTEVLVFFNRPVVPLEAIEEAGNTPDPLTFTPAVDGEGDWLNTATYRFTPADGFEPATEYTVRVDGGLTDVFGQAEMAGDFEWSFTTVQPAVAASLPADGDIYVSPSPVISVTFNQAMNRRDVEQALQLVEAGSSAPIAGQFAWVDRGMIPPTQPEPTDFYPESGPSIVEPEPIGVETVTFTPAAPLALDRSYELTLPQGVASLAGVATEQAFSASFTTTPAPAVVSTNPENGEQFAEIWAGLDITFNAPIDPNSVHVGDTVLIEPADIARTDVYTYFSDNETVLSVNFPRRENQTYTVTLTTDIEGRYGQPLAGPETIVWRTLRQSPYVRLVSPDVAVYNGYNPETYIYMTVRNVSQVNFDLYRMPSADFLDLAQTAFRGWTSGSEWGDYQPQDDDLIGTWQMTTDPETFVNYVYKVDVSQAAFDGEPLPPGIYYLVASADSQDFYPEARLSDANDVIDRQVLIVTRRNLTVKNGRGDALAWLTDLNSGEPVSDVPLTFHYPDQPATEGTSDDEGVALFNYDIGPDDPLEQPFVFAGDPDQPDDDFGVGSSAWSAGIDPYEFRYLWDTGYKYWSPYTGYAYTERPLYRPGQTVYFKGIIRADDDAAYSIPTVAETAHVVIHDALYATIYEEDLPLNSFGTLNGELTLDDEASLGTYQIEISYDNPADYTRTVAYQSFNVAEYRKPEFLVETATDQPAYLPGETIELTVDASFFAGGPVQNAEVKWTLLSDDFYFDYQGDGFYDFTNEPDSRSNSFNPRFGYGFGQQIADGSGTTDAAGHFTVAAPADLTGHQVSQQYTFDVTVTGLNNQAVSNRVQAVVHKGELYVGLRPEQYVGQIGQPNNIDVLVVDWDSQPVANQEVELVFAQEDWYSVQQLDPEASRVSPDDRFYWRNLVNDVAVFTTTVTTDSDGQAVATFTPDDGGSYKIYARTIDSQGNEVFSSVFMWVTGYEYVNWGQEDNDRIELIADKTEYSQGDTANILIPHPYSDTVTALITLERGHIYDHFVTELDSNSSQIEIPITEAMSPNIFVSAMIMNGGANGDGIPSFKMGYARLDIDPAEKALAISLTASPPPDDRDAFTPGDDVQFDINVADFAGKPVETELSVALIDKAVLTLFPDQPGQLFDAFWMQRALSVQTGSGLTLALDRVNRFLDERKGGGGGDGGIGPDSVRQNFADTVIWLPDVVTDENGQATVEATLPDNLTTWVLIAKGVTGADTLVGEARTEIVTSKPLLIRPVTPRFLVVGDESNLGLVVQNNTNEELAVEPRLQADGLTVNQWRIAGDDWRDLDQISRIMVEPGQEQKLEYAVTALDTDSAQITMGVQASPYSDGIAFDLPVYNFSAPETAATVGMLAEDGTRVEGIALPAGIDPSQGDLTVAVEPSLAAGMRSGLTYLEHFPYESVEVTVSRFLPNIVTYRAYQELGVDNPELADQLPRLVRTAIQRLVSQQQIDGGWGWWQQSESDPFLTAYAVLGLVEAQRADFKVDEWITQNAFDYLNRALVAPKDIAEPWQANRQAFILYVLAEAGQGDLSRSIALFEQREKLDAFGKAFLALAIYL
ncbi:MAG: Ig-like domain-containing protein, partial [Anaerolineae bacterium]|nr:Ig-like domain-containing protein [Anaerolineae bacterium]